MECIYLEKEEKQLYGIYHAPKSLSDEKTGIVLCYPLGQEYIRCHKLFVNLANNLAARGNHVMRFDYSGTGDSSGDFASVSIKGLLDDIGVVVGELKKVFGVTKIVVIGVRFGATLSLMYSSKHKVDKLVLWSPVKKGTEHIKDIAKEYKNWLSGSFTKEKEISKDSMASFGFLFSSALVKEIEAISLGESNFVINMPVLLIDDERQTDFSNAANITFEKAVNKEFWLKRGNEREKSMVPRYELNKISDWVNSGN